MCCVYDIEQRLECLFRDVFHRGEPSNVRERWVFIFFFRACVRARVGIPCAKRVIEDVKLLGSLYFAPSSSEMALRAGLDLGQFQMYWSVSADSKHLGQISVS